jgi:hypothetical protein
LQGKPSEYIIGIEKRMELLHIGPSDRAGKKMVGKFKLASGRTKTTHFGSKGMDDFTITGDESQKARYLARHVKNENWNDPTTAGALSRWILWNKKSKEASIADFKRRFNL